MPVKVIAECGVNWDTWENALKMIDASAEAKASYVKFQMFNDDTIREINDDTLKLRLSKMILTDWQIGKLKEHATSKNVGFIVTPMYPEAVDIAAKYADLIKIRYKDQENTELIEAALETRKPLIISVSHRPIRPELMYDPRINYAYCIPRYPPEPEDFNLEAASVCQAFSSHFPHTLFDIAYAINRFNADAFIEKHVMLTSDCEEECSITAETITPIDYNVSITFEELQTFISQLALLERMQRIRL